MTKAQQAIDTSTHTGTVQHLRGLSTSDYYAATGYLSAECDDSTDAGDGITEYYGSSGSGGQWRVHVHA